MTIQAAAERLRKHQATWSEEYRNTQQGSDEATLAVEYLRLTDKTPISRKILELIGFREWHGLLVRQNEEDDCIVSFSGGNSLTPHVQGRMVHGCKNLGQLRALCLALGIDLKETEHPNG